VLGAGDPLQHEAQRGRHAHGGARLWDVAALQSPQVSNGVAVSSERVFLSSWSLVVVLSLKTGEKQFTIGTG
jgi:hypothetical protein